MHKNFDHDEFADACCRTTAHQLISYNSSELVKSRFDNEWQAQEYDLTYTMRSTNDYKEDQKKRKELLLFNYERGLISILQEQKGQEEIMWKKEAESKSAIPISPKTLAEAETLIKSDIE